MKKSATVMLSVAVLTVALGLTAGIVGSQEDPKPEGKQPAQPAPKQELVLPATIPGAEPGVFVSNAGAVISVARFYQLMQSPDVAANEVLAAPFLVDGRNLLEDEADLAPFVVRVQEKVRSSRRTNTILSVKLLPAGNTWEEAQRWLAPLATGDRAKALYDHAEKHDGWLALVLLARSRGDSHAHEYTLVAVTNPKSESEARVIGFVD
jgi:hypothetical protein